MPASEQQLLAILRIGQDTTMRGEGMSLLHALSRVSYCEVREHFGASDLASILKGNPHFLDIWLAYSEDKRTSGGWWLADDLRSIGQVSAPDSVKEFSTPEAAVAEYVVRELDFWSTL
jgi:hypothetical protein